MLSLKAFQKRLDARGPDLSGWPADERQAAEALLARSAEARQAMAEAQRLYGLLASTMVDAAASAELKTRVLQIPHSLPRQRPVRRRWFDGIDFAWAGGLSAVMASAAAGFLFGAMDLVPWIDAETVDLGQLVYGFTFDTEGQL